MARAIPLMFALVLSAALAQSQTQQSNPPQPSGQAPDKELPNAPGEEQSGGNKQEKKDDNPNPVQQVAQMARDAATTGLLKARDWESSRIFGVYVGKNRKLVPMTRQQREEIYLHETLTTPEAYGKRMFAALIDQARGVPSWQGGIGGYAERFASREGQFITANSLAALGNAKLGYEVRYDQCKCSSKWHRVRHAMIRNFLTYNRSEQELRPQWALYGGAFGGGMLATAWKPSPKNAFVNGGWAVVGQAGYGTLLNLVTEFSIEINRKQGIYK